MSENNDWNEIEKQLRELVDLISDINKEPSQDNEEAQDSSGQTMDSHSAERAASGHQTNLESFQDFKESEDSSGQTMNSSPEGKVSSHEIYQKLSEHNDETQESSRQTMYTSHAENTALGHQTNLATSQGIREPQESFGQDSSTSDIESQDSVTPLNYHYEKNRVWRIDSNETLSVKQKVKTREMIIGELYFTSTRNIPFMRVSNSENIESVVFEIKAEWDLESPQIAIVVVSDPCPLKTWRDPKIIESFNKGLIKALNTTEMWLFTNGLNVGITKEIGKAFRTEIMRRQALTCERHASHKTVFPKAAMIGISSYDSLTYADNLVKSTKPIHLFNGRHRTSTTKFDLNPEMTHYIIVEDDHPKVTSAYDFTAELSTHLSDTTECKTKLSLYEYRNMYIRVADVPVMAVLVQGDIASLYFIANLLHQGLPVVVIHGSGGLADILAFAYFETCWRADGIIYAEYVEKVLKPRIAERAASVFSSLKGNYFALSSFCDKVLQCVRYSGKHESEYLTILDTHAAKCNLEELPSLLLSALFRAQKPEYVEQAQMKKDLHLAIDWNSPDVAMTEVFAKICSRSFKIDDEVFIRAVMKPKRDNFVSLFLKQGFLVHTVLSSFQLIALFRNSYKEEFFRSVVWEGLLGYGPNTSITTDFIDTKLTFLIEDLTGVPVFITSSDLDCYCTQGLDEGRKVHAEQKTIAVLVLWAVLSYRIDLVKAIWQHSEQPIHLALIVSVMLRKLRKHVVEITLRRDMKNTSKEFSSLATGILDACYIEAPNRAYDTLRKKHPVWAYKTLIEIAAFAQDRKFLAHPVCQKWLDRVFMGNIQIRDYVGFYTPKALKVILSAVFILPMYKWVIFQVPIEEYHDQALGKDSKYRDLSYLKDKMNRRDRRTFDRAHKTDIPFLEPFRVKRIEPALFTRINYMWSAPITKFWIFEVCYFVYLALFSLAVLWPSCGNRVLDTIICSWTTVILMDCIHITYRLHKKYPSVPMVGRCVEIAFIVLFVSLYVMGRVAGYGVFLDPYHGKVLICFGLLYFYYRIIFISLPISPLLGPLLYRVKRMVLLDFVNFMRMTLVVMVGNGIVLHAIIYPDYPLSIQLARRVFDKVYVPLFTTTADDYGKPNMQCVRYIERPYDPDFCRAGRYVDFTCPNPGLWPYLFVIQYLVLLKLNLITLLYVLFSATSKKLKEESDFIWKYQRYQLVVDFAERNCLPAPFSIISYMILLFETIMGYFDKKNSHKNTESDSFETYQLSALDYRRYWPRLAQTYYKDLMAKQIDEETRETQIAEATQALILNCSYLKNMIFQLQGQITELKVELDYTQEYMDSAHRDDEEAKVKSITQKLSRITPYPNTNVQRFPVPNSRVTWTLPWFLYDPVAYSLPKEDFPNTLQGFVDDDLHLWLERHGEDMIWLLIAQHGEESVVPFFKWNQTALSPAGIFVNRMSWMTDETGNVRHYKIDSEGLPRNPIGRTGLRGRGGLARWGPNHHIFILITRWKVTEDGEDTNTLEALVTQTRDSRGFNSTFLLGGFVPIENQYLVVRAFIKEEFLSGLWETSEDMITFFQTCSTPSNTEASNFQANFIRKGYLDDPQNTDQSWIEIECWHFSYYGPIHIEDKLKITASWVPMVAKMFEEIVPEGLVVCLRTVIKNMNAQT